VMSKTRTFSKPPFLKEIKYKNTSSINWSQYPFSVPILNNPDFRLKLTKPITVIVGDNGSGKSTILEAIAANCGFSLSGGSRNHAAFSQEHEMLSKHLVFSWLPKVTKGFFLRAETYFSFIREIDDLARETGTDIYDAYGGKSLRERSHGESFIALFENRFGDSGIFLLDEPEAALSPSRQLEFLRMLRRYEEGGQSQFIIVTHSVLVMAMPNVDLIRISDGKLERCEFHETEHFKILRDFAMFPDGFIEGVLLDNDG